MQLGLRRRLVMIYDVCNHRGSKLQLCSILLKLVQAPQQTHLQCQPKLCQAMICLSSFRFEAV